MTMIDLNTRWLKIAKRPDNSSAATSKLFNNYLLSHYLWPNKVIYDNGPELKKIFGELCQAY